MRYLLLEPKFTGSQYDFNVDKGLMPLTLARRYGWDVSVACTPSHPFPAPVRPVPLGHARMRSVRTLWRLSPQVDVLHLVHFNMRSVLHAALYKIRNPRGICWVRLQAEPMLNRIGRWIERAPNALILRAGLSAVDMVSAESSTGLIRFREIADRLGSRRCVELLVPCCGFDPVAVDGALGTDTDVPRDILYVGRLGPSVKGVPVLLAAFQRVRQQHRLSVGLRLVGPSDAAFHADFATWSADAPPDVHGAVSIQGPVWDRTALLRQYLSAKVFVVASRSEGGPNAFAEAASCGCLLVGTRVGIVPQVIRTVGTGWDVPIDDPEALGDALAAAVRVADTTAARAERIRSFRSGYAWASVVEKVVAALATLAESKRPAR